MTHSPSGAFSQRITITTTNPKENRKEKEKRLSKHVRSMEVERADMGRT